MDAQPSVQAGAPVQSNFMQKLIQKYGKWGTKLGGAVSDQAIFAGSNFLVNILLARWMSPLDYGAFVVAYSWLLLPQNFYEALLTEPMVIFGSGKYGKRLQAYLGYAFYGHIVLSGLVAVALLIGAVFVYFFDSQLLAAAMMGAGLSAPLVLTRWLTRQPFYITSRPHWSAIGGAIYMVFALFFLIILNYWDAPVTPFNYCTTLEAIYPTCARINDVAILTPFSALLALGVAGIIASTVLTVFLIRPKFKLESDESLNTREVIKDHWGYGKWASGIRVLAWVPANVYYIVLPIFVSLAESGALRALNNLVLPIFMSMSAITAILMPTFVRTFRSYGKHGLNRRMGKIVLLSLVFTGGYFVMIVFFGPWIMNVLYNGKFDDIVTLPILLTMAATPLFMGVRTVMDAALRAMGGVRNSFISKIIPTIFTLTVGIALLANIGILGATLSNMITAILAMLTLGWQYRRVVAKADETKTETEKETETETA
jgi:O-antigen/teichoic acid export membrane protein